VITKTKSRKQQGVIQDIRATFKQDRAFSKYFASKKWTEGLNGRRPNLLSDVALQYMLSENPFSPEFLGALIASVLGKPISAVQILSTHIQSQSILYDRPIYLDVLSRVDGAITNIEVQLYLEKYYDLRCVIQMSGIMIDAMQEEHRKMREAGRTKIRHDEIYGNVPHVITINILGFYIDETDPDYYWRFQFRDGKRPNRIAAPEMAMICIELPKVYQLLKGKNPQDLKTDLDRWMYFYVMCNEPGKLEAFLSNNAEVFRKYEEKMEEVSKMPSFVERYENSIFFQIESMVMTPEEERDSYKEERDSYKEERDSYKQEMEEAKKEAKKMVDKANERAVREKERAEREKEENEQLKKELESLRLKLREANGVFDE
jgi:hypothetical protein